MFRFRDNIAGILVPLTQYLKNSPLKSFYRGWRCDHREWKAVTEAICGNHQEKRSLKIKACNIEENSSRSTLHKILKCFATTEEKFQCFKGEMILS